MISQIISQQSILFNRAEAAPPPSASPDRLLSAAGQKYISQAMSGKKADQARRQFLPHVWSLSFLSRKRQETENRPPSPFVYFEILSAIVLATKLSGLTLQS